MEFPVNKTGGSVCVFVLLRTTSFLERRQYVWKGTPAEEADCRTGTVADV